MKKNYVAPALLIVEVQMEQSLLTVGSPVQSLGGNVFNQQSIGGSNQAARVKRDCYNVWDDDWATE